MDPLQHIFELILNQGFGGSTMDAIEQFTNNILHGRTNLTRFNLQEHAGLCSADSVLIGAYIVACYARASLTASSNAPTGQECPPNWKIDAKQEELVQKWAETKNCWFPNFESLIISKFGPKIAQGAEAIVFYKSGDTSVVKERTSIYATLSRAFEAIVLHNTLFPETQMRVIGFTRDSDGLFRTILTQPYVECERLASKEEIDIMVAAKGFVDNHDGQGVNYVGERLYLEDMHPANVFIDKESGLPICIDCIVKFK